MSTFNYTNIANTANRLVSKFGNSCKIAFSDGGSATAQCVMTSPTKEDRSSTTITETSKIALVTGNLKKMPSPGDQLTFAKVTYGITRVADTTPDGATTCLYRIEVST